MDGWMEESLEGGMNIDGSFHMIEVASMHACVSECRKYALEMFKVNKGI